MAIYQIQEALQNIQPYMLGFGTAGIIGVATLGGTSLARGLRAGSTIADEWNSNTNRAVSAGIGSLLGLAVCAAANHHGYDISSTVRAMEYAGVVTAGAGLGIVGRALHRAATTPDGLATSFRNHAREGAIRGMIAVPLAYGLLDAMSRF